MRAILIADDVVDNVHVLEFFLRAQGFKLLTATGGQEAIGIALAQHPDLILLDIMMADLDGLTTCKRLQANPRTRGIPIVFCTARADDEHRALGRAAGAIGYLVKPFSLEELSALIERLLPASTGGH